MQSILLGALSLAFGKGKLKLLTVAYKVFQDLAPASHISFPLTQPQCLLSPLQYPSYFHSEGLCCSFFRNALYRFCSRLAGPRVRYLFKQASL